MENQELIKEAIECAEMFLESERSTDCGDSPYQAIRSLYTKGELNKGYQAFKALVELTSENLKKGKSIDECKYDPIEIAVKIKEDWGFDLKDKNNREALRITIKRYFRELKNNFAKDTDKFKEISASNNFLVIPLVGKVGSKGYHRNKYYLTYVEIGAEYFNNKSKEIIIEPDSVQENPINESISPDIEEEITAEDCNKSENAIIELNSEQEDHTNENISSNIEEEDNLIINYIEYDVDFVKLPKYFNWMFNYKLSTARRIYLFLLVCFEAISFILLMYKLYSSIDLSASQFIKNSIWIITINLFLFFDAKKILDCIADKKIISITPPLTTPSNFYNTQLECVATKERNPKTGRLIRKVQLVSYTAICPLCEKALGRDDVRIDVSKGGKEFHNRLIGRCSESPIEHIFSFDHITRIGKPLRNS